MEIIMYVLLVLAAFIPAAFFMFYIMSFDNYKPEPLKALLFSALLGGVAAISVIGLGLTQHLGIIQIEPAHSWKESLEMGFLKLAIPAEVSKWIFLCIFLSLNKYYDEYIDGIVYSVCMAMGYAGVWGAWFLSDQIVNPSIAVLEKGVLTALILIPLHFIASTFMGYFLALARKRRKIMNHVFSLFFPLLIDGILCFTVILIADHWVYYFFIGTTLAILAAIVYSQIFRLLEMDGIKMK